MILPLQYLWCFFVCFTLSIPSGKIKYAYVYMKKWIYVVKLFVPVCSLQQNMALPKQNSGGWEVWGQAPA